VLNDDFSRFLGMVFGFHPKSFPVFNRSSACRFCSSLSCVAAMSMPNCAKP
jgi:hypothetical protein